MVAVIRMISMFRDARIVVVFPTDYFSSSLSYVRYETMCQRSEELRIPLLNWETQPPLLQDTQSRINDSYSFKSKNDESKQLVMKSVLRRWHFKVHLNACWCFDRFISSGTLL